ncbi:MarR family winged helix-turn-helix transcriptional regulator [Chitinophaga ginsengisoli]|uniref:DNA-binding MarR family transcriptional regulator n=1 Tax=Chitinophaga ginsengisoli TaxID=363837 RepID=A0A2P8G4J0_9BACT|nr:MarR family transcriptional regulator [Chitinophaga ginsengisoli]PSL28889.1 DNA-binding MarR family transcriptional regulator [Chitinophaga ginsengisoli]
MRIEQAINQRKFKDDYHKIVVNLLFTGNWLRDALGANLKEHGLLPQHYNALRIIKGRHPEPVSAGDIKDVMLDKASDVTRLLDKLEKLEYVQRRLCPHNRRKMDISITPQGLKLLSDVDILMDTFYEDLAERITEEEAATLSDLLDKIRG